MNLADILARLDAVCARGAEVQVVPARPSDPSQGYVATVKLATPWRSGPEVHSCAGDTPSAALAGALVIAQRAPPGAGPAQRTTPAQRDTRRTRRPSGRIDGRWYVTDAAALQYAALMRLDVEQATDDLIEISEQAHLVRRQRNGLDLWRVKAPDGRRIRLLVGPPDGVRGAGAKPALVSVLDEHG